MRLFILLLGYREANGVANEPISKKKCELDTFRSLLLYLNPPFLLFLYLIGTE